MWVDETRNKPKATDEFQLNYTHWRWRIEVSDSQYWAYSTERQKLKFSCMFHEEVVYKRHKQCDLKKCHTCFLITAQTFTSVSCKSYGRHCGLSGTQNTRIGSEALMLPCCVAYLFSEFITIQWNYQQGFAFENTSLNCSVNLVGRGQLGSSFFICYCTYAYFNNNVICTYIL